MTKSSMFSQFMTIQTLTSIKAWFAIVYSQVKGSHTLLYPRGVSNPESATRSFHRLDEIGNNANIGIRGCTFYMKTKNSSNKMLLPMSIEPLNLSFQVQHSPF